VPAACNSQHLTRAHPTYHRWVLRLQGDRRAGSLEAALVSPAQPSGLVLPQQTVAGVGAGPGAAGGSAAARDVLAAGCSSQAPSHSKAQATRKQAPTQQQDQQQPPPQPEARPGQQQELTAPLAPPGPPAPLVPPPGLPQEQQGQEPAGAPAGPGAPQPQQEQQQSQQQEPRAQQLQLEQEDAARGRDAAAVLSRDVVGAGASLPPSSPGAAGLAGAEAPASAQVGWMGGCRSQECSCIVSGIL
jgi:hypothetical protein